MILKRCEDLVHQQVCEFFWHRQMPVPGQSCHVIVAGYGFRVNFIRKGCVTVESQLRNLSAREERRVVRQVEEDLANFDREPLTLLAFAD